MVRQYEPSGAAATTTTGKFQAFMEIKPSHAQQLTQAGAQRNATARGLPEVPVQVDLTLALVLSLNINPPQETSPRKEAVGSGDGAVERIIFML